MFSIHMSNTPVFIMDNAGDISNISNISNAREGSLVYDHIVLNFIEKDGFYAYSEFFSDGDWPNKYYYKSQDTENGLPIIDPEDEDGHLPAMYSGIKLIMVRGGWHRTFSELAQIIPDHKFYEIIDVLERGESAGLLTEMKEMIY